MLSKLYNDLEYEKVIHLLADGCQSHRGKELASLLKPLDSIAEIKLRQDLISEVQKVLELGIDFDFSELLPLEDILVNKSITVYNWEEFRLIYLNIRLAITICQKRKELVDFPKLSLLLDRLVLLPFICKQYEQIFDTDGEVKETASEELKRIYKHKTLIREQIIRTLQHKFTDSTYEHALQEKYITQRVGRYVIPVKDTHTSQLKGIVQGLSGSKSTVFMEPDDVVGLNNDLQLLSQEEKREIYRIFKKFTEEIKSYSNQLLSNYQILGELDLWFSVGRMGKRLQALMPEILDNPVLNLVNARHPLLIQQKNDLSKVIPFNCCLSESVDFIILSGPNTGGKTVLLKAVGLLTLMALTGLPIPCKEGTQIGYFSQVMADVGDEQSIEHALSTFSSHLSKIKIMLELCNSSTLVLLDEIGAATDPQQGSALAQAMLEAFIEKQAKGMVTTHYTALKVFAENHSRCENASMQFDLKSLHPTYQFTTGFPGDSFAIEVAGSLGLPDRLVERAKQLTGSQNLEFTELIKRLQEEKKTLARETFQFQLKNRNLDAIIKEYENKIKSFESEIKLKKKEILKEQQQELINFQKQLLNEMEDIRQSEKNEKKRKSESLLAKVQELQKENLNKLKEYTEHKQNSLFKPRIGDTVWLIDFETNAVIIDMHDNEVLVDMNGISFKTYKDKICESQVTQEKVETINLPKMKVSPSPHFELKLLGLTFDEAQPLIDDFIDNAILSGIHSLRIVHGKGTGALRTKIRHYLKTKKVVKTIGTPSQEMGGNGVTVITI